MKRALKVLLVVLGLALFAGFIHRAGPRELLATFERLGPWLPVVLLPYLCVYLLDTLGWYFAFGAEKGRPSFPALFRFRWAGEAVNNVVPTGYVGGEAVKVWLLHKRGYPMVSATTSVVVAKTVQIAAQVLFLGLGAWMAFSRLPAGSPARRGMALVAVLAAGAILLLFWIQSRGLFRFVHGLASRWRIRSLAQHETRLRELDDRILGFYRRHPRALLASGGAFLAGWICDALELFVVSRLLGFPMDFPTAIAIESFISVAKALGVFVPGALGVQESGVWLLFQLFGFTAPQAIAYAILRRGREVIYATLGAALLYLESGSLRGLGPRVEAGSHSLS